MLMKEKQMSINVYYWSHTNDQRTHKSQIKATDIYLHKHIPYATFPSLKMMLKAHNYRQFFSSVLWFFSFINACNATQVQKEQIKIRGIKIACTKNKESVDKKHRIILKCLALLLNIHRSLSIYLPYTYIYIFLVKPHKANLFQRFRKIT